MRFYKISIINKVDREVEYEGPRKVMRGSLAERDFRYSISSICEKYSEKIADKGYFFLVMMTPEESIFGMVIRVNMDVEKFFYDFVEKAKLPSEKTLIQEITLCDFGQMLECANRNDYIYDDNDILREYELEELIKRGRRGMSISFGEKIIRERDKEAIYLSAENYFTKESFLPELDRIFYRSERRKAYGHPVDYMIESDDERTQQGVTLLLLQALYNVGRIENRRYCEFEIEPGISFHKGALDALYKSCVGGAIVVNYCSTRGLEDDLSHGEYMFLEDVCDIARRHCCDVLTILVLPCECRNLRMTIFENMVNCTFIEIKEELAYDDAAMAYLKRRAKEYRVRTDKELLGKIQDGNGYRASDLNVMFDEWYARKLKTTIYCQYKQISGAKSQVKEKKPKGTAYEELDAMIGLVSAKKLINQAIDSYKAQKIFKDKGMKEHSMCNHMVFTGNPGTAKTSVARLFARIMKENDLLSKGHIVEVGRCDLVGKYVGWTAPTIKSKFREATGGVLFIDEAYSLVDDRDGSYGDEAINTIVQEMENYRDKVIVIFAGYPDKMEGFLDKNPGLRSRIAHYVHFDDYDCDELCRIAEYIAGQQGLELDGGAREKLRDVMSVAEMQSDFGNGRYVRNVIEKARMAQSSRLVRMDYDSVTVEDVKKIYAEDIEIPVIGKKNSSYKIGFMSV